MLEALLRRAIPQGDARALACELIRQYRSIGAIMESEPEDIARMSGCPPRAAQLLCLIPGLARRCLRDDLDDPLTLNSFEKAAQYVRTLFIGAHSEQFYLLSLNGKGRLIDCQLLQQGSVSETPFYPRQIVETALRCGAHAVLFSHNHPGGTLGFSVADLASTRKALKLLGQIGIPLIDHLLVAGSEVASLRGRNFLSEEEWMAFGDPAFRAEDWLGDASIDKKPPRR